MLPQCIIYNVRFSTKNYCTGKETGKVTHIKGKKEKQSLGIDSKWAQILNIDFLKAKKIYYKYVQRIAGLCIQRIKGKYTK